MKILLLCMLVGAACAVPSFRSKLFRRDDEECFGLSEECGGLTFKRCCGDTVCFREDGISITGKGRCVRCISLNEKCQTDAQCCEGAFCRKEGINFDGVCNLKLGTGAECRDDDACLSGDCDKSFPFIKGECT